MLVREQELRVNYMEELEPYLDRFDKRRIRGVKLQSCSPFRLENSPSFAVNLDNGLWVDSGADTDRYRKGNFISLLAYLNDCGYAEIEDYLIEKYGFILEDTDNLKLDLEIKLTPPDVITLAKEKYETKINKVSEYLLRRGISEEVQLYFNCGISENGDAVVIPWHDKFGRIINVKYRKMENKDFWYSSGGHPIKQHVYGLFAVKSIAAKTVWVVESEIDCLYLWSKGIPAIALGGASISDSQKELILSSGISDMVIATDNDGVGRAAKDCITNEFISLVSCWEIEFPTGAKDVNDCTEEQLYKMEETRKLNRPTFI